MSCIDENEIEIYSFKSYVTVQDAHRVIVYLKM